MEKESYITIPHQITDKSFQIIQEEIEKIDPNYQFESPLQEAVIKRAIHTTADFDYLKRKEKKKMAQNPANLENCLHPYIV